MRNDAERYDWNDPPEAHRRLGAGRADADLASLRVWQDANEDGISDAGELKTLAELRRMLSGHPKAHERTIASISVNRTDVAGTNEGHDRGFAATFMWPLSRHAFQNPASNVELRVKEREMEPAWAVCSFVQ